MTVDYHHLPETLALRVQALREQLGYSLPMLARKANLPQSELEDIEAGLTGFLSTFTRQRLARALRIRPDVLKTVESYPLVADSARQKKSLTEEARIVLLEQCIQQTSPEEASTLLPLVCPNCRRTGLQVRRFLRYDLHGNPVHAVKVRCTACWFGLEHG